jgi:hypothetical protein
VQQKRRLYPIILSALAGTASFGTSTILGRRIVKVKPTAGLALDRDVASHHLAEAPADGDHLMAAISQKLMTGMTDFYFFDFYTSHVMSDL